MSSIEDALSEGADRLPQLLPLLTVPALVSLLNVGELRRMLDSGRVDFHFHLEFAFPTAIGDLWSFINPPDSGPGTIAGPGTSVPLEDLSGDGVLTILLAGLLTAFVYLLVYAALTAGYLGSIQQFRKTGSYDFLFNVNRYLRTYLGLTLAILGTGFLLIGFVFVVPPFIFIAALALLAIGYLFWGAWFLVPTQGLGAIDALRESARLAINEREYAVWTLAHMGVAAVLSVTASAVMFTGPPILGLLLGLVIVVPVGFVLTVGSLHVIDGLTLGSGENDREYSSRSGFEPPR